MKNKSALATRLCQWEKILAIAMTEPGAGSDLAAMRTRAVRDGDSYILNGSKTFISMASWQI